MVSFNTAAVGGVYPYAGALVTIDTAADETCKLGVTTNFILGVCEESGILQGQINVILRGVVTVTATGAVLNGAFLDFNGAADGTVKSVVGATRMVALTACGAGGGPILALLLG
jgi:hypothetical protein